MMVLSLTTAILFANKKETAVLFIENLFLPHQNPATLNEICLLYNIFTTNQV